MSKEKRADELVDWLGLAIAKGDYPVGQVLPTEPELMALAEVGRSTVREAIRVLGSLGVVETAPRRGTVVTDRGRWNLLNRDVLRWVMASRGHAADLMSAINEARLVFEPSAAALVADRADRMQLIAIETAFARMEVAAQNGDAEAAIAADRAFHLAILSATGNPILEAFDAAIDGVLGILFSVAANHMENFRANLANHQAILDAIRARDADAARAAMTATITFTTTRMKEAGIVA
ncbi:transcriptional regulator, GntR family (plasmid) [Paracoccus aminophilus JCM 7686]|uniref:Transcriptional regulator, GntR family n=2 Tax=Paracoccus aminophilus TaxID=34003 RepID=S5YHA0_PARAH|nr:transcriptional regulator, GntR family [Paracoccus aminophilus JCM 7686]